MHKSSSSRSLWLITTAKIQLMRYQTTTATVYRCHGDIQITVTVWRCYLFLKINFDINTLI